MVDANIFPKLIEILATGGKSTRIEAAWAVVNLTSVGTLEQLSCLLELNVIPPLCEMLNQLGNEQVKLVEGVLNSLYILLILALKNCDSPSEFAIKECGGFDKIEGFKSHQNENISQKAVILTQIFSYKDEAEVENEETIKSQVIYFLFF